MQDKEILLKMDSKLYKQLKRYANKKEEGNVSLTARKAIRLFISENEAGN